MRTYLTNCILTFDGPSRGAQAFLNLRVPLEAGEEIVRAFFDGINDALHPIPHEPDHYPDADAKQPVKLRKVSMCVLLPADLTGEQMEANPALAWFWKANGKIYFDEANAVLGSADPRG